MVRTLPTPSPQQHNWREPLHVLRCGRGQFTGALLAPVLQGVLCATDAVWDEKSRSKYHAKCQDRMAVNVF